MPRHRESPQMRRLRHLVKFRRWRERIARGPDIPGRRVAVVPARLSAFMRELPERLDRWWELLDE